jgi:aspartate/methionine/tyrosine aminotransferase
MSGQDSNFFFAESYIAWVQALVADMARQPDSIGLFDASLMEPSLTLRDQVTKVVSEPGRPRLRSVMDSGNPLVIQALATRYQVPGEQVLCTTGALSGVALVMRAYLQPGDHILIERPHLDTLVQIARQLGAEVTYFDRDGDDAAIDPGQVRALLQPNTRLVLLTNLHNPTGAFLDDDAMLRLAAALEDHPAKILVDEVYADFAHQYGQGTPACQLSDTFISVNSLSKVYGLSALKCGWIVADAGAIARIAPVHAVSEFGISKLTHAVASALLEDLTYLNEFTSSVLADARPVLQAWATQMEQEGLLKGALPDHGCLYFPRLAGVDDSRDLCARLWRAHKVVLAPGELFQRPGHVRIGFGRSTAQLASGLDGLAQTLRAVRDEAGSQRAPQHHPKSA